MKKKYSLDYSIELDKDRMEAVRQILDELDTNPSPSELEQLASYVLYGKDENGLNSVQRGETDDRDSKRYKTYKTVDEKAASLDEILEDPLANQTEFRPMEERHLYVQKKRTIKRPKYDKITGEMIDPGDSDIPGMVELWEAIDRLEHTIAANKGQLEFNVDDTVITDPYRLWQLNHMLADLRRHQYYLLEHYKPMLHFNAVIHSSTPTYNFDSDSFYWIDEDEWVRKLERYKYMSYVSKNIEDYETRINEQSGKLEIKWVVKRQTFDWENPWHIRQLINNYSAIYMQDYDKLDSWGRTLIYDFDRYFDKCGFSPVREYILLRRIDKATTAQIQEELQLKFGLVYKEDTILNIVNKEIPNKMADTIMRERLLRETPMSGRKLCATCKRALPATPLFFIRNASKSMGVESSCKECQRKKRIARGEIAKYDKRYKDTTMHKMQTGKTDS